MRAEIEPVTEATKEAFYALACEYLPDTDPEQAEVMRGRYPSAFLVLKVDGEVTGAALGWPRSERVPGDPSFTLQGICVRQQWMRMGFGSRLLRAFEQNAAKSPCTLIGAGSAPGDAERFYLKNAYHPSCYKAFDPSGQCHIYPFASTEEYLSFDREAFRASVQGDEGFVVMEKALPAR